MPIKSESVIQDVIEAVESGQLIISDHAATRMKERNIDFSDVEEAVYRATRDEVKDSQTNDGLAWKYALRGFNDDGNKDIRLIVLYLQKPKMLLVTAIDKNE
jgi:hypothetical protein